MKRTSQILFVLFSIVFLYYLSLPNLEFPASPPGAVQSFEPADSETPDRRGYFTNFSREEVLDHYSDHFTLSALGITIPSYQLIYPPEDAYSLVRDQTRSTHLREIVYPFRESIFVNEFVAKSDNEVITYKGIPYDSKITVSIKQSSIYARLGLGVLISIVTYLLSMQVESVLKYAWTTVKDIKWPWFWN